MYKTLGYAAHQHNTPLVPFQFERRELLPNDVHIKILYCGVCHSDIHQVRNEWGKVDDAKRLGANAGFLR
jgi:uncharacterized zinc-type alcohol dehydrogenase-like protein